jgi:hypothetical protein
MTDPTKRPPADWLPDIAESEAELAAGDTIPAETVVQSLRDSIARLEAKQDNGHRRKSCAAPLIGFPGEAATGERA